MDFCMVHVTVTEPLRQPLSNVSVTDRLSERWEGGPHLAPWV